MKTRKLIGAFSIAAMAALALTGCSITVSEDTADDTTSDTTTDTDTDTGTSTGDNGTTTGGSTDS
ncbi:MAG: hypothetical protein K6G48_00055, partial [Acholeplasmatales bacterium]|nr:hypothetical protein [Acholeplasmatales bacterium]